MTANKIIKAMESAIQRYKDATHHVSCIVDINILKEALGTIKEQKAEIEGLLQKLQQAKSEALMHAFSKFAGHSDYHGDTILCQLACMAVGKETKSAIPIDMNQIKSEAIKEFAERFEKEIETTPNVNAYFKFALLKYAKQIKDNLVKEMTEVETNQRKEDENENQN